MQEAGFRPFAALGLDVCQKFSYPRTRSLQSFRRIEDMENSCGSIRRNVCKTIITVVFLP